MNPKVKVIPVKIKNKTGYDIQITDSTATVQDYLDALNYAILREPLARTRAPGKGKKCYGCDLCCGERIPLTLPDALALSALLAQRAGSSNVQNSSASNFPQLQKFLARYGYVLVEGRAVDITLRLDEDGFCPFLDRKRRLCTVYEARPLVCQTFICCPQTRRARDLRSAIVNTGEDELVRQWLLATTQTGKPPLIHEALEPDLRLEDWKATAFASKINYSQVFLKDICSRPDFGPTRNPVRVIKIGN